MYNLQSYLQTVLDAIFGGQFTFYLPYQSFGWLSNRFADAMSSTSPVEYFVLSLVSQPQYVFSLFVWLWFAVLIFKLTILLPFKFLKSVVKRK